MSAAPTRLTAAGFTLIELMITVAIVGVLAAIAAPSMRELILTQYVRSGASDLQSTLYFARSEAIKRAANVSVVPISNKWENGWSVQLGTTVLRTQNALSDQLSTMAASTIIYSNDGRVTTGPSNIVFKTSNTKVTARCVVVDLSGRPSVIYDTNGDATDGCN